MIRTKGHEHELELVIGKLRGEVQRVLDRIPRCYDDDTRLFACEEAAAYVKAISILDAKMREELAKDPQACKPGWAKRAEARPSPGLRTYTLPGACPKCGTLMPGPEGPCQIPECEFNAGRAS